MLDRLEDLNNHYFAKFGCVVTIHSERVVCVKEGPRLNVTRTLRRYIFIVCATGKSADEMVAILESRVTNAPSDELPVAAAEQSKITKLRLEKLLAE